MEEDTRSLIRSFYFKRLAKIAQLGCVHYLNNLPMLTRYEHSVMVMKITERISKEREHVLLALFHDIGHFPFSHDLEGIFEEYLDMNHNGRGVEILREFGLKGVAELLRKKADVVFKKKPYVLGSDKIAYIFHDNIVLNTPFKRKALAACVKLVESIKVKGGRIVDFDEDAARYITKVHRRMWRWYYLSPKAERVREKLRESLTYAIKRGIVDVEEISWKCDLDLVEELIRVRSCNRDFLRRLRKKMVRCKHIGLRQKEDLYTSQ